MAIGDSEGSTTEIGGSIDLEVVGANDDRVDDDDDDEGGGPVDGGDEDTTAGLTGLAADLEASSLNSSLAKSSSSLV